jgi:predicted RNA-binding Zn-ribbon protein involved in translation (DUF1610 family)
MSEKKEIEVQQGGGRLKCPKCGNVTRNKIREAEDREHQIFDYPVIFGKKYHCGMCGIWWRWEKDEE